MTIGGGANERSDWVRLMKCGQLELRVHEACKALHEGSKKACAAHGSRRFLSTSPDERSNLIAIAVSWASATPRPQPQPGKLDPKLQPNGTKPLLGNHQERGRYVSAPLLRMTNPSRRTSCRKTIADHVGFSLSQLASARWRSASDSLRRAKCLGPRGHIFLAARGMRASNGVCWGSSWSYQLGKHEFSAVSHRTIGVGLNRASFVGKSRLLRLTPMASLHGVCRDERVGWRWYRH